MHGGLDEGGSVDETITESVGAALHEHSEELFDILLVPPYPAVQCY